VLEVWPLRLALALGSLAGPGLRLGTRILAPDPARGGGTGHRAALQAQPRGGADHPGRAAPPRAKGVKAIEDTSCGIVVQGLRGDRLASEPGRVLLGDARFQAVQWTAATARLQPQGQHAGPCLHLHRRRHVVLDQADEAPLGGLGLEKGQMGDGGHRESGWEGRHRARLRGLLAPCSSWLTSILLWLWPLRSQHTIRKNALDHSIPGAECKFWAPRARLSQSAPGMSR